jgi:Flp pilus assembly protein TadD
MISTLLTLLAALLCGVAGTLFEVTWFRVLTPILGNTPGLHERVGFLGEYVLEKVKYPPKNAQLRREVAGLHIKRGDYEQAVHHLEIAVVLAPHSAITWYTLGAAARRAGRYKMAEDALKVAVDIDPENWRAWKELGMLYLDRKKMKLAREALGVVLELRPDDVKSPEAIRKLSRHGF